MPDQFERLVGGRINRAVRRLVLLGVPARWMEGLRGTSAVTLVVARDSEEAATLATRENSAIFASLDAGEDALRRLAIARASQTVPPVLITCGGGPGGAKRSLSFDAVAHLEEPPDALYLCGLIDGSQLTYDGKRLRTASQVMRIQTLYELSSRLLRTMQRSNLGPVLGTTLPRLLDVPFILVALPHSSQPLPYAHCPNGITAEAREMLREHLRKAWEVLAPDERGSDWSFLDALPPSDAGGISRVAADSFVTTPITRGTRTCGFFTVLPDSSWSEDEPRMQTFFVIGDLLGVVLYNFDLLEELERRATHDGLTGLNNRQTVMERFEAECQRARRYELPISVLVMDLDHFKKVNDTFGHQAGDAVLKAFARALGTAVRDVDFIGRAGGEEFVAVLPQTGLHGACQVADRVRSAITSVRVPVNRTEIGVTVSIGVASATGAGANVTQLLARADEALYRAKQLGRNRVEVDRPKRALDLVGGDPEESIDLF